MLRATLALIATLLVLPSAATAAPGFDIRGTWTLTAVGVTSTITWTTLDCATGAITGDGRSGSITWPETGTLDGMTLSTESGPYSTVPSYTFFLSGTFSSPDAGAGTFTDTWRGDQVVGSFTLARVSGPPAGSGCAPGGGTGPGPTPETPPALHPTATQVMCTYVVATSLDTCTATVGDAAAQPTTPTGTITFGKQVGGFLGDGTCVLASSPSAPSTASCAVTYQRPFGSTAFPAISATYGGDATHAASSGATSFLILGGPPSFSAPYPNQLQLDTAADADGTRVTACATVASKSVRARAAADPDDDVEALTRQVQQADDKATAKLMPAIGDALARAREQLERDRATYQQRLQAGDRAGAAAIKRAIDATTKAIDALGDALDGQCKATTARGSSATAAAAAAKRTRSAVVLGTRSIRSAKAGKLSIRLKLASAKLKRARKSRKTVTVYVHVLTRTPSGLLSRGWPRAAVYAVKLDRRGRPVT